MEPALRILSTAIGEVGAIGLSCLMALHIADLNARRMNKGDGNVRESELMATVHVESLSTLRRHLGFCSAHEYASMVKTSRAAAALWHITDIGRSIVIRVISLLAGLPGASTTAEPRPLITAPDVSQLAAEEKNFFSTPSSSSSDPDQFSGSDQIQNQIEEEEEGIEFKKFLCREFNLTGEPAQRIIADPRIWSDDLVAWIVQVRDMKRNGFKFRKTPESYALGCLLKPDGPDMPSDDAVNNARPMLERYWQQFQQRKQSAEEDNT